MMSLAIRESHCLARGGASGGVACPGQQLGASELPSMGWEAHESGD